MQPCRIQHCEALRSNFHTPEQNRNERRGDVVPRVERSTRVPLEFPARPDHGEHACDVRQRVQPVELVRHAVEPEHASRNADDSTDRYGEKKELPDGRAVVRFHDDLEGWTGRESSNFFAECQSCAYSASRFDSRAYFN